MTDMEIEDGHRVLTPGNEALATKAATGVRDPHLFAESLWNTSFFNDNVGSFGRF
jgi:hypothetical protein